MLSQENTRGVVLDSTHSAQQHPLQFCKCGLSHYPVGAEFLWRVYLSIFHGSQFSVGRANLHNTQLLLYFSLLESKHNNALCIPKYSCHHLTKRGLHFELLWPHRPWPYTLATLSFILWLIIMDQVSSTVTRRERKSSSFDLNRFNNVLYTDALVAICLSLRDFGTQRLLACAYPNDHVKLLKCYHVKCVMHSLFLPP